MMTLQESCGVHWRRRLGIKLGVFEQHPPRPLPTHKPALNDLDCLPSISLVTPSFNQGHFIGSTVRSVLAQGYPHLQYVIQDGGSTDSTLNELSHFPKDAFHLAIESDSGQADAINRGFDKCDGEVLGYINSDDILIGNALISVGRFFRDHPDVDVIYGNRLIINAEGAVIGRWILPGHDEKLLHLVDYVPQETLFWRRRAWLSIGSRLDTNLNFAIDWDLLLKLQKINARINHLPWLFGGFRVHASQKTSKDLQEIGCREMASLRERFRPHLSMKLLHCRHAYFLLKHVLADIRHSNKR